MVVCGVQWDVLLRSLPTPQRRIQNLTGISVYIFIKFFFYLVVFVYFLNKNLNSGLNHQNRILYRFAPPPPIPVTIGSGVLKRPIGNQCVIFIFGLF